MFSLHVTSASNSRIWGFMLRPDLYREGQINVLHHVQKKAAKFANPTNNSGWETLAQRKKVMCICTLFKAYTGEWAWKSIRDRLKGPFDLNKDDHEHSIWARIQRTDISKYSFVNRTIKLWSQQPTGVLQTFRCNSHIFRKRVRKVIISEEK